MVVALVFLSNVKSIARQSQRLVERLGPRRLPTGTVIPSLARFLVIRMRQLPCSPASSRSGSPPREVTRVTCRSWSRRCSWLSVNIGSPRSLDVCLPVQKTVPAGTSILWGVEIACLPMVTSSTFGPQSRQGRQKNVKECRPEKTLDAAILTKRP